MAKSGDSSAPAGQRRPRKGPEPHGPGARAGFSDSLVAQARTILAAARAALEDRGRSEAEAVHELRKAFKHWRALMRLLSGPIGEPADRMRVEARDLMQALSRSRDAQAAFDAIADIAKSDPPLSPTSRKTIEARVAKMRDEAEAAGFTPALRERTAQYLDDAARVLPTWPLAGIGFDALADALAATYRRARRLVPKRWTEAQAEDLHELRKRVVEHRHQMELLEPLWPRMTRLWADEAQRLRERLGACQDLTVLEGYTGPHHPLAPWRSRLAPLIAERRERHLVAGARLAGRLFAEKPRAFRKRIGALRNAFDFQDADG